VGARGQVARALVEYGSQNAVQVTAIGRPDLDFTKPDTMHSVLRAAAADVIVNAAAYTAVDDAEQNQDIAYDLNARGPIVLARCARDLDLPFIHLSTDYVFDGEKSEPYTEEDSTSPLGQYGKTKAAGERGVLETTSDCVILRTAWIFSPFGRNFVTNMLHLARQQQSIRVVRDQYGSPTYALDLAAGIISVSRNLVNSRSDRKLRGVFHIAGHGYASWAELAAAIFYYSRRYDGPTAEVIPIATAEYATRARRPRNSRLDCSKLASIHRVTLPSWDLALQICISRLLGVECEKQAIK
jgi:dTDP-4-dehydrorhamnose reductase